MPAIVPKHLGGDDDDDWETDPDFVNTMSEEQQRWGGARDTGVLDMDKFREEIKQEHINETKKRQQEDGYKSSTGWGRLTKWEREVIVVWQVRREVRSPLRQTGQVCRGVGAHRAGWQTQLTEGLQDGIWWQGKFHLVHPLRLKNSDCTGREGRFYCVEDEVNERLAQFGVQSDRVDKSAVGWEHVEKVDKHNSQKGKWSSFLPTVPCLRSASRLSPVLTDYKDGFGGSFGVQKDRVDKSAVGWEHHEQVVKHESQTGRR